MAISVLSMTGEMRLSSLWKDGTTGARNSVTFGGVNMPALNVSLAYGTGSGQANWVYYASRTVSATTADNLDLSGSLTDGLGNTISATKLKLLVVAVSAPDGTKTIRVGPRGVANTFQGPWGGTGATVYTDVTRWGVWYEPTAGWTITNSTADILGLFNPSAGSVTYSILMAGV